MDAVSPASIVEVELCLQRSNDPRDVGPMQLTIGQVKPPLFAS